MPIKEFYFFLLKRINSFKNDVIKNEVSIFKKNYHYLIYLFFLFLVFITYILFSNQINAKKIAERNNLNQVLESNEFIGFEEYFFKTLKNPYKEFDYTIQNNDSIEGILTKFNIKKNEIKFIVSELKEKKLDNIYTGRKISLVVKETDDELNSVVNILYPISSTLTIEIRKNQNITIIDFENVAKKVNK